jgi:O-antigen/teichoic acid export membrane protein
MGMAVAFIAFSSVFVDLGFSGSIIQAKRSDHVQINTIFFINVLSGLVLTCLFYAAGPLIGSYFESPEVTKLVRVLSFSFVLTALASVQEALLRKEMDNRSLAQATVLSLLVGGVVAIALAARGFGVWGLVAQQYLVLVTRNIWVWRRSAWRPTKNWSLTSIGGHFKFGSNLFLAGLVTAFFNQLDTFVLGRFYGAGTLGQFYRAKSFLDLAQRFLSRPLGNVFFPYVSLNQDDQRLLAVRVRQVLRYLGLALCSTAVLLYFLAEPLVLVLFGAQWGPSVPLAQILVFGFHVSPISTITASVLIGRGQGKEHLGIELAKRLILLVGVLVGVTLYGLEGYLWGWVIAGNAGILVNIWSLRRSIKVARWQLLLDCLGIPVLVWGFAYLCYISLQYLGVPTGGGSRSCSL